jgi:FixJ family two-component response regulator
VRRALQRLLRSAGMDVETFKSGVEFLNALLRARPDCVVLDLHMSGISGFDVQDWLVQCSLRLPMVVITGHDTPESRMRAIAGGADFYLLKPIDDQLLLDAIAAAIAKRDC